MCILVQKIKDQNGNRKKRQRLKRYKFHKINDLNVTKKMIKDQNVTNK
jgi:hypothetical protein